MHWFFIYTFFLGGGGKYLILFTNNLIFFNQEIQLQRRTMNAYPKELDSAKHETVCRSHLPGVVRLLKVLGEIDGVVHVLNLPALPLSHFFGWFLDALPVMLSFFSSCFSVVLERSYDCWLVQSFIHASIICFLSLSLYAQGNYAIIIIYHYVELCTMCKK